MNERLREWFKGVSDCDDCVRDESGKTTICARHKNLVLKMGLQQSMLEDLGLSKTEKDDDD